MPDGNLLAKISSSLFVPLSDLAKAFVSVVRNPPDEKVVDNADIIVCAITSGK
jgi:hypothetical protein